MKALEAVTSVPLTVRKAKTESRLFILLFLTIHHTFLCPCFLPFSAFSPFLYFARQETVIEEDSERRVLKLSLCLSALKIHTLTRL